MAVERDPESLYFGGQLFVFCGEVEEGFGLVRRAIDRNYCAATGLASERIWEPYREDRRFLELQQTANACRDRFFEYKLPTPTPQGGAPPIVEQ